MAAIALITFVLAFGVIATTGSMGSEPAKKTTALVAPQHTTGSSTPPVTTRAS